MKQCTIPNFTKFKAKIWSFDLPMDIQISCTISKKTYLFPNNWHFYIKPIELQCVGLLLDSISIPIISMLNIILKADYVKYCSILIKL